MYLDILVKSRSRTSIPIQSDGTGRHASRVIRRISGLWFLDYGVAVCISGCATTPAFPCHLIRRLTQLFELGYLISHSRRLLQSNAVAGRSRCLCCSRVCALSVYLSLLLRHSRSCFSLLICGNQLVPIVSLSANW